MSDSVFQNRAHHPLVVLDDDFVFEKLPDEEIDIPAHLIVPEDEEYVSSKQEEWNDLRLQEFLSTQPKKASSNKKNE